MIKKSFLYVVMLLLMILPVFSIETYIDEEIEVFENGQAIVSGTTNLNIISDLVLEGEKILGYSEVLTEKKGKYWLFTYHYDKNISNYLIKLTMPEKAQINHIGSKSKILISTKDSQQVITFIGKSQPLNIKVQYTLGKTPALSFKWDYIIYGITILFIFIAAWLFILRKKNIFSRKTKKQTIQKTSEKTKTNKKILNKEKLETIKLTLNENQLKIMDALLDKKGEASQTELRYMTGIAKSSLSRNLELMTQKQIISKFYNGTSNYIKIHPSLYKNQ